MLRLHDEPSVWKAAPAIAAILAMLGAVPTAMGTDGGLREGRCSEARATGSLMGR